MHELDAESRRFVDEYCERNWTRLTPVTVDPAHPFPRVINKALCLGLLLRRRRRSALTYTEWSRCPRSLPRLVRLPSENTTDFIFLADLVAHHAQNMYHGYDIVQRALPCDAKQPICICRKKRRGICWNRAHGAAQPAQGDAVRMEIEADADPEMIERLRSVFELDCGRYSGEWSGEFVAAGLMYTSRRRGRI